mmetsp:Transcript_38203/g.92913  ORF Transcript_38203/g.92913 Transcript_38203/m.92913 type:complete len:217 (+) Transcript_38203:626-1276(+)
MYSVCCFDNVLSSGELSLAKSPHPVLMTGATAANAASISGGGVTASATGSGAAAGAGAAGGGGGGGGGAAASTTGAGAGAGSGSGVAAVSSTTKFANGATSSPSSTVTMIGVPTAISAPEPASIKIFAMKPSSCASKSIEALSVSIFANACPAENSDPSSRYHSASTPVSIVGLNAGIPTTIWYGKSSLTAVDREKNRHDVEEDPPTTTAAFLVED